MDEYPRNVEQRLEQLEKTVKRIVELQDRASSASSHDPETALMHARKAAEAICRSIFVQEVGPSVGNLMLDGLIQKLSGVGALPKHIQVPLRTIQAYGNLGAHEQDDGADVITPEYVRSCLQSLGIVVDWYMRKYGRGADVAMAASLAEAVSSAGAQPDQEPQQQSSSRRRMLWLGGGIALVAVAVGLVLARQYRHGSRAALDDGCPDSLAGIGDRRCAPAAVAVSAGGAGSGQRLSARLGAVATQPSSGGTGKEGLDAECPDAFASLGNSSCPPVWIAAWAREMRSGERSSGWLRVGTTEPNAVLQAWDSATSMSSQTSTLKGVHTFRAPTGRIYVIVRQLSNGLCFWDTTVTVGSRATVDLGLRNPPLLPNDECFNQYEARQQERALARK